MADDVFSGCKVAERSVSTDQDVTTLFGRRRREGGQWQPFECNMPRYDRCYRRVRDVYSRANRESASPKVSNSTPIRSIRDRYKLHIFRFSAGWSR